MLCRRSVGLLTAGFVVEKLIFSPGFAQLVRLLFHNMLWPGRTFGTNCSEAAEATQWPLQESFFVRGFRQLCGLPAEVLSSKACRFRARKESPCKAGAWPR